MLLPCAKQWSEKIFGSCNLGDRRRTKRLVQVAEGLARHIGQSMVKSCADEAEIEGAYRLIRNNKVSSSAIAEGGFQSTAEVVKQYVTVLALEDSTSLTYRHDVRHELGSLGSYKHSYSRGMMVHSVLPVDADTERTLGLIEQQRWCRSVDEFGKRQQRKTRIYENKESFKWEQSSVALAKRLGGLMPRVISVCDRESDVYEYLHYKLTHEQRFVIRACQNRQLAEAEGKLFEYAGSLKGVGEYTLAIPQKGGRPARQAKMALSYAEVTLSPPLNKKRDYRCLTMHVVVCEEITTDESEPLHWLLLTTEPIASAAQARKIVHYYERRWTIEDYHKVWKSGGTQVEKQRMQSVDNLERMAVILGFVAVRLLQLKESVMDEAQGKTSPCTELLTEMQWTLLWLKVENTAVSTSPPSMYWAYYALAKLGGWYDSKRTGKVGWNALWDGWYRLGQMVEGATIMNSLCAKKM